MTPILILTRPAAASERTRADVARLRPGSEVIVSPVIEIEPLPVVVETVPDGLILTSENGASVAATLGLPAGMAAWCVGGRTAEVATAAGFAALSAEGDAEALLQMILGSAGGGLLLHLRGEHARGDIVPRLRAAGRAAAEANAYRQTEQPLSAEARAALQGGAPVVVPLFSPRSAAILAAQGPFAAPLWVVAMSAATARAAAALEPAHISHVDKPDGQAMLSAIVDSLSAASA
jgi:uroporphyrinogen-III synthase